MRKTKNKCSECRKKIISSQIKCGDCNLYIHKTCAHNFKGEDYICTSCQNKHLPFNKITNFEFLSTLNEKKQCFRIQSLIDDFKRNKSEEIILSVDQSNPSTSPLQNSKNINLMIHSLFFT